MDCPHENTGLRLNGPHIEKHCFDCGAHICFVPREIPFEKAEVFPMPFGKYKGRVLRSIPRDYLEWGKEAFKGKGVSRYIAAFLKGPKE